MSFIDHKMQFSPSCAKREHHAFLGAIHLCSSLGFGAINDHEAIRFHRIGQDMNGQRNAVLCNTEVRNGDASVYDSSLRIHAVFGLAKGRMKDLADKRSGFYCDVSTLLRSTTGSRLGRAPPEARLFCQADRDITLSSSIRVHVHNVLHRFAGIR